MKIRAIFVACSLSAPAALAEAGACRPLEYAQIKDTATEELVAKYCNYVEQKKLYTSNVNEYQKRTGGIDWGSINGSNECTREQEKITTALKARSAPMPSCDPSSADGAPKPVAPR